MRTDLSFKSEISGRRLGLLSLAAAIAISGPAIASSVTPSTPDNWTGNAGNGMFQTTGNWSTGSVPTAANIAVFDLGTGSAYTVSLGVATYSSQMLVDNNTVSLASGGYIYTLSGTGGIGSGNESLVVVDSATDTAATLTLGTSGFEPVSGVNATIGESSGSVGVMNIGNPGTSFGGNALRLSGSMAVGYGGNGTLTVNSGYASVGGDVDIAALTGSIGKVDIEMSNVGGCSGGGSASGLNVTGNLYVGGSSIGGGGAGTLLINGSNGLYGSSSYGVQVTGATTIYSGSTVTLNSGELRTASIINSGTLNFAGGTLDLTNSNLTVGGGGLLGSAVTLNSTTYVPYTGATPQTVPGQILTISGTTNVATGASLTISGGELDTGALTNGGGTIVFTGGKLSITNSDLIIDTGGPLGTSLSLGSGQTLDVPNNNLIVGNTGSGSLTLGTGADVAINQMFIGAQAGSNGNVTSDGTISANSIFVGGTATGAAGTGTLTLTTNADLYGGTITVYAGGTLNQNAASNLNDSIDILTGGHMNTTGSSFLYAADLTNAGLVEVQNGSLEFTGTGPLANGGGTIQADSGTTVQLFAITVSGGSLAGNGSFVATSATLDGTPTGGLTNNSTINVADSGSATAAYSLTLQGTITNNGQINITSTGDATWLYINGPTTIAGKGTITLADNGGNTAFLGGSPTNISDSLINQGTVQGSGTVGNSSATNFDLNSFANSGTVDANASGKTLLLGGANSFTNTGTLEATNGGTLAFASNAIIGDGGGTILASGTGSVVALNGSQVQGGTLNEVAGGVIKIFGSGHYQTARFDGSVSPLTLASNFSVNPSDTLDLSGNITLDGSLSTLPAGGGYGAGTVDFRGATTLSGSGSIIMASGSYLEGYDSNSTLTNQATISGAGRIVGFSNSFLLNNSGTVNANVSGATLYIYSNGGNSGITNSGTLEATGGATLDLGGSLIANSSGNILASGTGSVLNLDRATILGGSLSATGGGSVALNGGIVQGGTLTTDANSQIYANSGTLDGTTTPVTLNGNLNALNSGIYSGGLTLKGTINNSGTMIFHSGELLSISGNVVLNGSGVLQLNDNNGSAALLQGADFQGTDSLTNNSIIQGAGTIGDPAGNYNVGLVNTGTIDADVNGQTLNIYGTVTNSGTLEATNGGTLYVHTNYTQTAGVTYFGGGGGVLFGGNFTLGGGYGFGSGDGGSFSGSFYNTGGSFGPGNPQYGGGLSGVAGVFTIVNNYSGSSNASTDFHIGGTGQGTASNGYDYLVIGGTMTAGGQLGVQFVNNFQKTITSGDSFTIIKATGGITGSFSNAISGGTVETTDGFGSFNVSYGPGASQPNEVILSNFAFTPGGGGSPGTAKIGTALGNGGESFSNVYSGSWIDPAGETLVYTMTSGALFTKIDAFRSGYDNLTITVDGTTYTGFGGDAGSTNTFDFSSLAGGGATTFSIGNIVPGTNPFAVQLEFNTPQASFTVTPASTPEPAALAIIAVGGLALLARRRIAGR